MNRENLISSIRRLKILLGENNFEEAFLKELYNTLGAEEIYLLNLENSNILGWKFKNREVSGVSYSLKKFEQDFNLDIEKIKSEKEGLIKDESLGISQKVFVFPIEDIFSILILKRIDRPDLIPFLDFLSELFGLLLYSHYTLKKFKETEKVRTAESLAFLAHEIKNPLTTIKTAVELLLSKSIGEEERRNIAEIIRATILELTEEIENLCSQDFEQKEIVQNFSLSEVINEILDEVKPLAITKKVEISTNLKDISFHGNRANLKKALMNLVMNAIKYNKPKGKVFVETKEKGNKIFIKIKDTGIGIPKEIQKKIFEKFFRGRHENISGTGLGLYIVKKIVEFHNGKIKVNSSLGYGSEFIVSLPKKTRISKRPIYFLFMALILTSFALLNIFPLIPYKPTSERTREIVVFKTRSNSLIRIKTDAEYKCGFRKTLLGSKDKAFCELRNGNMEADLTKTDILIKTPFVKIRNLGTSFDIFTSQNNTGVSVFDGTLVGRDKKLETGTGAIIAQTVKIVPLLNSVRNINAQNLPSGDLEITWDPLEKATGYEIMISEDKEFYKIVRVSLTKETRFSLTLFKDGYYYIKIYGIDENGLKGFPATKKIKNFYHLKLGEIMRKEGKYKEALVEFEKSFNDFKGEEVLPLSEIAWTYYITGNFDLAENKYKEALKIKSTIGDLTRLARIYYHKDKLEESKRIYLNILSENKNNLDALWGLAEVFIKEKNILKAEKYLEKIKNIDNTYPLLHYSYAKIYLQKGQKERALKEIEQELIFHPDSHEAKELLQEIKQNKQ